MSISYVDRTSSAYVTDTGVSVLIPANVVVGELLLAVVMHRDTLTPQSGWTLVASQSCIASGATQYISVYKRVAQSGDAGSSTTWSQATSQRMVVSILNFSAHGSCDVVAAATAHQDNLSSSSNVGNIASASATGNGQLGVAIGSMVVANNSPAATAISVSNGHFITTNSLVDNRIAIAVQMLNSGDATTGTFTSNTSPTTQNGWVCVSVVLGDSDAGSSGGGVSRSRAFGGV